MSSSSSSGVRAERGWFEGEVAATGNLVIVDSGRGVIVPRICCYLHGYGQLRQLERRLSDCRVLIEEVIGAQLGSERSGGRGSGTEHHQVAPERLPGLDQLHQGRTTTADGRRDNGSQSGRPSEEQVEAIRSKSI